MSNASFLFLLLSQPLKPHLSKLLSRTLSHEIGFTLLSVYTDLTKTRWRKGRKIKEGRKEGGKEEGRGKEGKEKGKKSRWKGKKGRRQAYRKARFYKGT